MRSIILTIAAVLALGAAAIAKPVHHPAKHAAHTKAAAHMRMHHAAMKHARSAKHAALICPVTGEKIASVKKAFGHSTYKGKTYYFCCPMCKPKFDKDPARYVRNAKHHKFEKMGM